jgi:hypothetical protein
MTTVVPQQHRPTSNVQIERHERLVQRVIRYFGTAAGAAFYVDVTGPEIRELNPEDEDLDRVEHEFVATTITHTAQASPTVEQAVRDYGLRDFEEASER